MKRIEEKAYRNWEQCTRIKKSGRRTKGTVYVSESSVKHGVNGNEPREVREEGHGMSFIIC